jgi:hypothetical protein
VEHDLCEGCILEKHKNVSFVTVSRTPKLGKLNLVHIDLWGPSLVESHKGSWYYITFIDDSSIMVWVYFLKSKSDVFETFKKRKAMVKTTKIILVLRILVAENLHLEQLDVKTSFLPGELEEDIYMH